jgi:hypothetical protein
MFDRIFSAALTFCLLAGGTLAIGSAMLGLDLRPEPQAPTQPRVIHLQRVEVIGQRADPASLLAKTDKLESARQQ